MDNCWISCQITVDMKKVHDDFIIINLYIESANFTPGAHGSKQSITDSYIEFDISKSPLTTKAWVRGWRCITG